MSVHVQMPPLEEMTPEQLADALADPLWRLSNLYWIKTKSESEDDDDEGLVVRFRPNRAQRRLVKRLHTRNIILKARQLGFTTFIQILFLDAALFTPNISCGVIAHTEKAAKNIFKKIAFAYDRLPPFLREAIPTTTRSVTEIEFANGSKITVAVSLRSDTLHYLHVSEFGKICAKFPARAEEVLTGSIPSVSPTGMIFIESTAEGRDGPFYEMSNKAEANHDAGKKLTAKEYRFHFFPWHDADEYAMDPTGVAISEKEHKYFDALEAKLGKAIGLEQRAWWISTRDNDLSGSDERMWQEYPSTSAEAFQKSTEGTYFKDQIAKARKEERFTVVPWVQSSPVNTFWDIGLNDKMTIWMHQHIGTQHRFLRYYENDGEAFAHYWNEINRHGYVWGHHYLPHDADARRLGANQNKTPREMLEELGMRNIIVVPRTESKLAAIQQARDVFGQCWFDANDCKEGIIHLESYRKEWNERLAVWKDEPRHDVHSNGADSFMQFAQGYRHFPDQKPISELRRKRSWRLS